jgi:plasmid maintenance system killer protein
VLNHDIAKGLGRTFELAVRQLEQDWKQHPYYQHLQRNNPEQAQLTMNALRVIRGNPHSAAASNRKDRIWKRIDAPWRLIIRWMQKADRERLLALHL